MYIIYTKSIDENYFKVSSNYANAFFSTKTQRNGNVTN